MTAISSNPNRSALNVLAGIAILYYAVVIPEAMYIPIGAILATYFILNKGMGISILSADIIIVALFCVSHFYFDSVTGYSQYAKNIYGFTLFIMYLFGYCFSYQENNAREADNIERMINIIYYGLSFYIISCVIYTYLRGYSFSTYFRTPLIFWNNAFGLGTHFGTFSSVPLAISMLKVAETDQKKRFGHICIMVSLVTANLLMSNRVIIAYFAIFFASVFIIKHKKNSFGDVFVLLAGWLSLLLLMYFLYSLLKNEFESVLSNVPLFSRIQELNDLDIADPRLEKQSYIINHFFENIRGGGYFSDAIGDPHNVWLDFYDRSGIIPFLLFLSLTLLLIKKIAFLLKSSENSKTNSLCIATIIGFIVSFIEESVFRSTPPFMILFFFCSGLIIGYCNKCSSIMHNPEPAEQIANT